MESVHGQMNWKCHSTSKDQSHGEINQSERSRLVTEPTWNISRGETVKDYRFLGITISNNLRFQAHVKYVVTKGKRDYKKTTHPVSEGGPINTVRPLVESMHALFF